jgi:hypothetical protein
MIECKECGMLVEPGEYHPYAACLMFKACGDGSVVRANLVAVLAEGYERASEIHAAISDGSDALAQPTAPHDDKASEH